MSIATKMGHAMDAKRNWPTMFSQQFRALVIKSTFVVVRNPFSFGFLLSWGALLVMALWIIEKYVSDSANFMVTAVTSHTLAALSDVCGRDHPSC